MHSYFPKFNLNLKIFNIRPKIKFNRNKYILLSLFWLNLVSVLDHNGNKTECLCARYCARSFTYIIDSSAIMI